jgi:hypothetical protein
MQQDALCAVDFVECKDFCAVLTDDVFQVRELIVVEKCWAERYTRGLRETVFLLDFAVVCALRDVSESLNLLVFPENPSDGSIARGRSEAAYPQRGDPSPFFT